MTAAISGSSYISKTHPGHFALRISGIPQANRKQVIVGIGFKRTTGAPSTFDDLVESTYSDLIGWEQTTVTLEADESLTASVRGSVPTSEIPGALPGDHQYLWVVLPASDPGGQSFWAIKAAGQLRA